MTISSGPSFREACERQARLARQRPEVPAWVPLRLHRRYVEEAMRIGFDGEPLGEEHAASICRRLKAGYREND